MAHCENSIRLHSSGGVAANTGGLTKVVDLLGHQSGPNIGVVRVILVADDPPGANQFGSGVGQGLLDRDPPPTHTFELK